MGFPVGSVVKNSPAVQEPEETWVGFLSQEETLQEEKAIIPVFLPGDRMDQGTWQAVVHGVAKSQT